MIRATILPIVTALVMLLAASPVSAESSRAPSPASVQWALPDAQGHVVIINFWATWCAPCRAEMPALDAYYLNHRNAGLDMLAISMDDPSKAKAVRDIAATLHFDVAMARNIKIPARYRPTQLPVTLVFDRSGALRFDSRKAPAVMTAALLSRIVDPLLAEPARR